jgi:flagellar secretion chaperone FliS
MVKGSLSQQYREMRLVSSTPEETVLMLYDGVIRFLKEAAKEITEKNITAKIRLLEKAEKIIDYLHSCLDMEKGGEIAENLDRLYDYMLVRLTEANLYNDVTRIEEIANLLGTVREGWAGIGEATKKGEATIGTPENKKGSVGHKNIVVRV